MSVRIVYEKCAGCGSCYEQCPNDVIGWNAEKGIPFIAYPDECSHCGVCALECGCGAIEHIIPLACYDDLNTLGPSVNRQTTLDWKKFL